jgi:Arc/MetJ-type ribon-helix-helix transcriptional regulator
MSDRSTITASIIPELNGCIAGHLSSDRSANVSEVIRATVRLMEQHQPDPTTMQEREGDCVAGGR